MTSRIMSGFAVRSLGLLGVAGLLAGCVTTAQPVTGVLAANAALQIEAGHSTRRPLEGGSSEHARAAYERYIGRDQAGMAAGSSGAAAAGAGAVPGGTTPSAMATADFAPLPPP